MAVNEDIRMHPGRGGIRYHIKVNVVYLGGIRDFEQSLVIRISVHVQTAAIPRHIELQGSRRVAACDKEAAGYADALRNTLAAVVHAYCRGAAGFEITSVDRGGLIVDAEDVVLVAFEYQTFEPIVPIVVGPVPLGDAEVVSGHLSGAVLENAHGVRCAAAQEQAPRRIIRRAAILEPVFRTSRERYLCGGR
jgi:hypothetical protein